MKLDGENIWFIALGGADVWTFKPSEEGGDEPLANDARENRDGFEDDEKSPLLSDDCRLAGRPAGCRRRDAWEAGALASDESANE